MINYWWVTRPKRRLDSIPEVLATFADISLNQEWNGQPARPEWFRRAHIWCVACVPRPDL